MLASPSLTSPALSSATTATTSLEAITRGCLVLALAVVPFLLEVHRLTFFEICATIVTVDHAVNKDIITAIIRSDETKAFVFEELLDNSGWHCKEEGTNTVLGVREARTSA